MTDDNKIKYNRALSLFKEDKFDEALANLENVNPKDSEIISLIYEIRVKKLSYSVFENISQNNFKDAIIEIYRLLDIYKHYEYVFLSKDHENDINDFKLFRNLQSFCYVMIGEVFKS